MNFVNQHQLDELETRIIRGIRQLKNKELIEEIVEDLNEIYRMIFVSSYDDDRTYVILKKWEDKLK